MRKKPDDSYLYKGTWSGSIFFPAPSLAPVSPVARGLSAMNHAYAEGSAACRQTIKLFDKTNAIFTDGLQYETRSVDAQRGGYWVVYRNPVTKVQPWGKACVGQLTVGNATPTAFTGGTVEYTYTCDSTGAVWGEIFQGLDMAADWASAIGVTLGGPAAVVLGPAVLVANSINVYLDAAANLQKGADGGTAQVIAVLGRAIEGQEPAIGASGSNLWTVAQFDAVSGTKGIVYNQIAGMREFNADETWHTYLSSNSVGAVRTRDWTSSVTLTTLLRTGYGDGKVSFTWQKQLGTPNIRIYGK